MTSRSSGVRLAALASLCLGAFAPFASAADVYVLPAGAGTKDGASWANAKPGAGKGVLSAVWDTLNAGDTLHVGSGTYPDTSIKAGKGGAEGKPIRLVGEDRGTGLPLFTSNFNRTNPEKSGGTFFAAPDGVSNFELSNLHLKGYQTGINLRGKNSNLKLTKLLVEEAREGIRSEAGATEANPELGSHNVLVADCRFDKFTKRAVRMQEGNYKWRIERCFADAGGKDWGTESFPICYQVSVKNPAPKDGSPKPFQAKEHDIEFYDCVAQNCYYEGTFAKNAGSSKAYWNGDGYCSESGVKNLKFVRCISMHHTDGGWDLKADSPVLISCVSIDNKENYRFWEGTAQLTNCISAFANKRGGSGGASALWTRTNVAADLCTWVNNPRAISIDGKAAGATVTFKNSILDGPAKDTPGVKLENCATAEEGKVPAKAPEWTKIGTEFDSAAFGPAKGFSSTRWSKEK